MAEHGEATEEPVTEFDYDHLHELSALLGVDAVQLAKSQDEEEHKAQMKMKKVFNPQMHSEARRLKTFVTYDPYSSWTPQDMAAAGFYLTDVKPGVRCFCCSLILFYTSLRKFPIEIHKKFHPECEFLLGKDVGNIGKYDIRVKSPEKRLRGSKAQYQEAEARLESFEKWPFYAHGTSPRGLSAVGFVFTDQLFADLDKFPGLKELSVRLDGKADVLSVLPGEFPNLHHMEKLSIQTSMESDLCRLVKLIQNSPNLHVFHLKCNFLLNCESFMAVLAYCKKLREIEFSGRCFETTSFGMNWTTLTTDAPVHRHSVL